AAGPDLDSSLHNTNGAFRKSGEKPARPRHCERPDPPRSVWSTQRRHWASAREGGCLRLEPGDRFRSCPRETPSREGFGCERRLLQQPPVRPPFPHGRTGILFARASGRARAGVRTAIHRSGAAAAVRALLLLLVASGAACDAPAARDDTASTIVAVDDAGDTLRLAAPAQRIVSTVPAQTQILLALGAGDRIIARTDFDTQPELAHLPSTGNGITPNVEWIAAQRPDLVISWADTQSRSVIARLSALGIPAYASAVETIDDILRSIERLGALTDRDAAADSIVHDIRQEMEAVARDVANRPRTRVMYVIGIEPLMVAGPRTFVDEALTIAGGDNVFGDTRARWPVVSIEE